MALADELARLSPQERVEFLGDLTPEELEGLQYCWEVWARPEQLPPKAGNDGKPWTTWMALAGRGWGKTRAGAEWVRSVACGQTPLGAGEVDRIAIIGETAKDIRDVLIEGDSGILAVHPKDFRPIYEPSKNRVTWPNGAVALLYNGTEPDQLRGPQFGAAWLDELAKWRYMEEAYDMLAFGLRLGTNPRQFITTTPRALKLIKDIAKHPKTALTRGKTSDNEENLAESFLRTVTDRFAGTRLGRQELDGAIVEDVPNALWRREKIDQHRVRQNELPTLSRIVVSIDPAAKSRENQTSESGADTGIITCGLGADGRGYCLDDDSCSGGPNEWGRRALAAYTRFNADAIVAEVNNGGDMVAYVIRSINPNVKVIQVTATRGKAVRAEPVAALNDQGRISHVGSLPALEDQLCLFTSTGDAPSPSDRGDAYVWGFTELFPQLVTTNKTRWFDKWGGRDRGGWMS
jgi:phage terminase large subunit-like protein